MFPLEKKDNSIVNTFSKNKQKVNRQHEQKQNNRC